MGKFFQKRIMASEDNVAYDRSVIYYVAATPTEVTQGALVTLVERATTIFGTKDLTTYKVTAPVADTDPVYITDILETPYATLGTNNYRVGVELSDIKAPANTPVRSRKPKIDDIYIVGSENFASAPTVGEYAIPTAGSVNYTPSAGLITTKHCVLIEEEITVPFGMSKSITAYVCRVVTER